MPAGFTGLAFSLFVGFGFGQLGQRIVEGIHAAADHRIDEARGGVQFIGVRQQILQQSDIAGMQCFSRTDS